MRQSGKNYKRIVVKVGASLFCSASNIWDFTLFDTIARQITDIVKEGKDVVVVSSGAIAVGMHLVGLKERPKRLADLQATAAIGQNELMNAYHKSFRGNYFAAQILLTWEDFSDRRRYLNARNTLFALLERRRYRLQQPIPIINENDTVSTDEIKFGDNDRLSALVASLISADLLLILSDVDGLLDKDKRVIPVVEKITPQVKELACPTNKKSCIGGMITKIEAAKIAVDSGIPCVIANGRGGNIVSLAEDPFSGGNWTVFLPRKGLAAKKRWLAFSAKPKGKITVDDGAKNALLNKKSLLSVGVLATEGHFESGDIVSVQDLQNCEFARGKVGISSKQLEKVKGEHFEREVIHRDNIVIL